LVRVDLRVGSRINHALQAVFPDRPADRIDELDAELRMVVGEL
jgi:hypothetical protein